MSVIQFVKMHMRRSPYQTMAAILTMFLTFLLGGFFFLTSITSAHILRYFEGKPQITVFFTDSAGQAQADQLSASLQTTGIPITTRFVSKEQALSIYKEQNKNDPLLLEMVTAEILPASLEISTPDPKQLKVLEPIIQKAAGVEEVVYQRDVVDTLVKWTSAIRVLGGLLALILVVDSLLIVMTVIAMKIALKREEIEILKLIGASPWYIRFPFVLEGGLYGILGAAPASLLLILLIAWLQPYLYTFLGSIAVIGWVLASVSSSVFLVSSALFFGGMVIMGFLLGALGSMVALVRYLKF